MASRGFFNRLASSVVRTAKSELRRQTRKIVRGQGDNMSGGSSNGTVPRPGGARKPAPGQSRGPASDEARKPAPGVSRNAAHGQSREEAPGRSRKPSVASPDSRTNTSWDVNDSHSEASVAFFMPKGSPLPEFSYSPERNHRADPGEVVWTWVPFEEDPTQGKDRPVLVLAETNRGVIASQMTSRDRTEDFLSEDKFGRAWLDIGTGSWDQQGRNSEVRLDRLLVIPRGSMRREGGRLDKDTFYHVVRKIREVHEAHGWGEH